MVQVLILVLVLVSQVLVLVLVLVGPVLVLILVLEGSVLVLVLVLVGSVLVNITGRRRSKRYGAAGEPFILPPLHFLAPPLK